MQIVKKLNVFLCHLDLHNENIIYIFLLINSNRRLGSLVIFGLVHARNKSRKGQQSQGLEKEHYVSVRTLRFFLRKIFVIDRVDELYWVGSIFGAVLNFNFFKNFELSLHMYVVVILIIWAQNSSCNVIPLLLVLYFQYYMYYCNIRIIHASSDLIFCLRS